METATQIRRAENDVIQRAAKYERLTSRKVTLERQLAKAGGEDLSDAIAFLTSTLEDVDVLPTSLLTRGSMLRGAPLTFGGQIGRDALKALLTDLLGSAQRRQADRDEVLVTIREELAQVTEALSEYE